jgi:predicted metal-dependent hydrolase
VHELVHMLDPSHNARFKTLMDHFLPGWRATRKALNDQGLGHPNWNC